VVEGKGKRVKQNKEDDGDETINVYPVDDNGHDRLLNENEKQIARGMGLNVL
jgi:hypothetical protein